MSYTPYIQKSRDIHELNDLSASTALKPVEDLVPQNTQDLGTGQTAVTPTDNAVIDAVVEPVTENHKQTQSDEFVLVSPDSRLSTFESKFTGNARAAFINNAGGRQSFRTVDEVYPENAVSRMKSMLGVV